MGLIVGLALIMGGIFSLIALCGAIIVCVKFSQQDKKPYWKYIVIYGIAFLVLGILLSWVLNSGESSGAPTGDDYARWIYGTLIFSGFPGLGFIGATLSIILLRNKG